ncbi:DUF3310 domain-containing protein [Corynebacterium sp. HMSC08A12]|uniref:DUF3310 domain-containing protein n=1 Tax=Corynebacterium sp. HMSC08A12 TaxID=1581134 RepID=UPI0008A17F0E|nr:DUF3310 domain-containing protein [Corynebacterium sp. HMSC08A12]
MDSVNHPSHYQSDSGLEAIDVIEAFFMRNYFLGNVFKYIARAGKKGNRLEDLKKAEWYLHREIRRLSGEDKKVNVEIDGVIKPVGNLRPTVGEVNFFRKKYGLPLIETEDE